MTNAFDPTKFIDREFEQELFEELLHFNTPARILAIRDSGGMGKSFLLERFQYRCRTVKPRTAVSLIALDQLPDKSPLSIIKLMVKHLSGFNLKFDNFNRYESARQSFDFNAIRSSLHAETANFTGASDVRMASNMTNITQARDLFVTTGPPSPLTTEQDEAAREVIINCFFGELKQQCATRPVVLMLDQYENSDPDIQSWIVESLLERYFFDLVNPFGSFVLVLAGREIPQFQLPKEDHDQLVRSVNELGQWEKKHVAECLKAHGFKYTPEELDSFYGLIKMGIAPSEVVQMIRTALAARRGRS
jgi:hypothetical protein